jgi:predicted nucleic acid-binding protein
MTGRPAIVYWDSSIFLSYVNREEDRVSRVVTSLERATPDGDLEIVTSVLSVAEVASSYSWLEAAEDYQLNEQRADLLWDDNRFTLQDLDYEIALDARDFVRAAREQRLGLKPADAVHLATARALRADVVHTFDRRLFQYSSWLDIPITEPGPP